MSEPTDTAGDRGRYVEQQLMIKQAATRLHDEFAGTFNAATIERYINDSRDKLNLNATVPDTVDVFSGGSDPGAETNKVAVAAMAEVGIDIASDYPKPWTDEIARAADVIVSMGCGDACPIFPGKRYEDWELDDPSGQSIDVVRRIRDDIRTRVETLVASLQPATT